MPLLQTILRRLMFAPTRVAIVDDFKAWKAIQIYIAALHLARAIERRTDRPHIGALLPTSGLFPVAMLASWMLGRTIVPLNYLLQREELDYVIDDAELDLIVAVKPMLEKFGNAPAGVESLLMDELSFKGIPPFRRSMRNSDDDLAVLLYTSGTSGKPKGVMLTHGNVSANIRQIVRHAEFGPRDVFLGVLPQFHSFGFTVLTTLPLVVGCKAVYTARFSPVKIFKLLREHRPTAFIAIPSMYNALLSAKAAKPDDFESVRFIVSGGEPLPEAVAEGFHAKFGKRINEGYGLTETAPVTNVCLPDEFKPKSVGRTVPDLDVRIISDSGEEVSQGEEGEIRFRGPNIMQGYYKREDDTKAVFDEQGYFRTGDMGRLDEQGHLYITGRIKEMLIIGGENVFPREIEEVLNAHPAVHDSAVIGITDPSRGEVPLAFVELEEGVAFDEREVRAHCRESLAGYKVPKEIRVLEALPRNPTGKIMRRALNADTPGVTVESPA